MQEPMKDPSPREEAMVERYGELVGRDEASEIIGLCLRSIEKLIQEGELRQVQRRRITVRSIARWIDREEEKDQPARRRRGKPTQGSTDTPRMMVIDSPAPEGKAWRIP